MPVKKPFSGISWRFWCIIGQNANLSLPLLRFLDKHAQASTWSSWLQGESAVLDFKAALIFIQRAPGKCLVRPLKMIVNTWTVKTTWVWKRYAWIWRSGMAVTERMKEVQKIKEKWQIIKVYPNSFTLKIEQRTNIAYHVENKSSK